MSTLNPQRRPRSLRPTALVAALVIGCGSPASDNRSVTAEADPGRAAAAREAAESARQEARAAEQAAVGTLGIEEQP
ncbi:hypothetical protein [Tautonia sociabilis]|uniref:Uncharacterized protein n=1 Tax=Tautonia sociabilis TaxID=2080755 RepID=A0A432MDW2_9BACT|nr:hypothetical protein [Tautonia sociabilis]RUL83187.1 hypothetical protein TsocGM_22590 [Tautonia sociabilis]